MTVREGARRPVVDDDGTVVGWETPHLNDRGEQVGGSYAETSEGRRRRVRRHYEEATRNVDVELLERVMRQQAEERRHGPLVEPASFAPRAAGLLSGLRRGPAWQAVCGACGSAFTVRLRSEEVRWEKCSSCRTRNRLPVDVRSP